jgi:SAM-dependent methyltransferase
VDRLHPDIIVLPDTDAAALREQFLPFEALHHRMRIMNPMADDDLDRVVALLAPQDGQRAIDFACGHGELLYRLAAAASIHGVGVDTSPWVLERAAADPRADDADLAWWLGDAGAVRTAGEHDLATCLGASWVWSGFAGTVEALLGQLCPGGRFAFGDIQRRPGIAPEAVTHLDAPSSREEQVAVLADRGVDVIEEIVTTRASWDAYQDRVEESAVAWAEQYPGPDADGYLAEQQKWRREHAEIIELIGWTVWVGQAPG